MKEKRKRKKMTERNEKIMKEKEATIEYTFQQKSFGKFRSMFLKSLTLE